MKKPRILIVDDQQQERESLARLLRQEGYVALLAANPDEALSHLDADIDLVISDVRMGDNSGIDLLRYWKDRRVRTPFVMMTAYGEVQSAVEAMKLGAEDYITKPVSPEGLLALIARCVEQNRDEPLPSTSGLPNAGFEKIIAKSPAMLEVFDHARQAARVECTVMITGDSGTGKELLAEALHQNSRRRNGAYVTVNMAAVPDNLVESELFGHVKGSFTGATGSRIGRFEAAHRGTLFIDEIGDFALGCQAKLLRVLENHRITPIGSNDDRQVDVRVVAATSRHLEEMVKSQTFREDLYYRLNVVTIHLPPLRERAEDIPLLVAHFLEQICRAHDKPPLEIEPALMQFLQTFPWPGNVRQLRNAIESMVVLAHEPRLTLDDLPATLENESLLSRPQSAPANKSWRALQQSAVEAALAEFNGNRARAAESLGISVRTLQRKLKSWGLTSENPPD